MNTRSHWPYSELAAQLHPLYHGLLSSSPSLIDCRAISIHRPQGTPPALNVGYQGVDPTGPLPASIDFPLVPGEELHQFKALMIANPQPQTATLAADDEAIEIVVPRLESVNLNMHGMAELGMGYGAPLLHDLAHTLVGGHRLVDLHHLPRHATIPIERSRRDLRPEHESIRRWVSCGDAQREGGSGEDRAPPDTTLKTMPGRRK